MIFQLRMMLRLMRLQGSRWWLAPAIGPSVILAIVFGFLSQLEFTEQDRKEFQFGNRTSALYLNDWIQPSSQNVGHDFAKQVLFDTNEESVCIQLAGLIGVPGDPNDSVGFREISLGCQFSDFGYTLTSGSWPASVNEAVATDGLFSQGQTVQGVSPKPIEIVGTVTNKNDLYGETLLFAAGTWHAWDMDSNDTLYPRLQATYTVFLNIESPDPFRAEIAKLSANNDTAATIELRDFRDPRSTIIERFPFLYQWIIWPVSLASIAVSLALRVRFLRTSTQRLMDYGLNRKVTQVTILVGAGLWIAVALPLGLLLGWGLAGILSPIAAIVSGHAAGNNPFPMELGNASYAALAISLVAMIVRTLFTSGQHRQTEKVRKRKKLATGSRAKILFGLGAAALVVVWTFQINNVSELFALIFVSVFLACWFTPELTSLLSRTVSGNSLETKYAARRMTASGSKSWIAAASSIVAFGPFVAMTILLSSSVADSNSNELLPPREGQALFYASGDQNLDQKIKELVITSLDREIEFVPVFSPVDKSGFALVATSEGFGAVQSIKSSVDLETLLGRALSIQAKAVLDGGGVIWTREGYSNEIWLSSGEPQDGLALGESVFEEIEPRWANDTAGFVLSSTVQSLGLENTLLLWTINGLEDSDQPLISSALSANGVDSNYIRFPREENPISLSPFQLGIGSVLGFIGAALLAISLRSSSKQLQASSQMLVIQGVPRAWFRRVFFREVGVPALVGGIVGILVAFLLLFAGVEALGIALVVPFDVIFSYAILMFALFIIMMSLSVFQISRPLSTGGQ